MPQDPQAPPPGPARNPALELKTCQNPLDGAFLYLVGMFAREFSESAAIEH
jgi:hypothetical protein